jgi:hypothetical protein
MISKGLLATALMLALGITALPVSRAEAGLDTATAAIAQKPHPREKTFMKRTWGVEIVFVRQTSAGYMLEFRYRVLDAEKAKPLFDRQTKPVLTHVESGARMIVPTPAKTGALRNSNPPLDDHTYWMFFANPAKFVKPGDLVTVQIGDFVAENIIVE